MQRFGQEDIMRAAQSMIRDYGHRAAEKAVESAAEARAQKREIAVIAWTRIEQQIRELQSQTGLESLGDIKHSPDSAC